MDKLGLGLDTSFVLAMVTTLIDKGNVANLVKASEVLGEIVRRLRSSEIYRVAPGAWR